MARFALYVIFIPILFLVGGTFLAGLLQTSSLITGAPYLGATTCSPNNDQIFDLTNSTCDAFHAPSLGCQVNPAVSCGFQSVQFFNPTAAPTCLIEVSLTCFVNSITGLSQLAPQAFAYFNSPQTPIFGTCINVNGTAPFPVGAPGTNNFILQCNQDFANSTAYKFSQSNIFSNSTAIFDSNYNCTNYVDFATLGTVNYAFYGCVFFPAHPAFGTAAPVSPANNNETFGFIFAVNGTAAANWQPRTGGGGCPGGGCHAIDVQGQLLIVQDPGSAQNARLCIVQQNTAELSPDCHAWLSGVNSVNAQTTSATFGISLAFGFLGALVIFIIGLGLTLNVGIFTNTFGVGSNSQGTRFFFTLGISLLIWIPVLAESALFLSLFGSLGLGAAIELICTVVLVFGIAAQTLNIGT